MPNQLFNYKDVFRTAPATLGLINKDNKVYYVNITKQKNKNDRQKIIKQNVLYTTIVCMVIFLFLHLWTKIRSTVKKNSTQYSAPL